MLNFIQAHKVVAFILFIICVLYFILRLPNLTGQPIFADEAIYIRWAQIMKAEPTLRFISLSDGKTPLYMWLMTPFFKVFDDPLFAGRFLSIISGFATLLGALFLGWKFFNFKVGLWAALLIAITPYMVFFDRMALVDSMLATFSIWSLNFALLLIKYKRLDLAMFLGYFLGAGMLTKPPGFFNILVLPMSLLAFDWSNTKRPVRFLKQFGLLVVAMGIGYFIYSLLRLGPGFDSLSSRNQDYIHSPLRLFQYPLDPFIPHLHDVEDWFPKFFTWPILILSIAGLFMVFIKKNTVGIVIILWAILPLLAQMTLLKTFTSRYLLFSIPPLLCIAGWMINHFLEQFKINNYLKVLGVAFILLLLPLNFNYKILTDIQSAPLPNEARRGYLEDWTAGYGLPEIADILIKQAQKELVIVGTEGSFGTLPDGLQIYLDKYSHTAPAENQVIVIGGPATVSAQLIDNASRHPTYYIANKSRFTEVLPELQLIKVFPKAAGKNLPQQDAILFMKVLPGIRNN